MAEIGVHLKHIFIVVFERPFETRNVGRAQTEFTLAFHKEYTIFELFGHEPLDDIGRAVGTAVVDDQNVESVFLQTRHRANDGFNIFLLVIGRNDNNAVVLLHKSREWCDAHSGWWKLSALLIYRGLPHSQNRGKQHDPSRGLIASRIQR